MENKNMVIGGLIKIIEKITKEISDLVLKNENYAKNFATSFAQIKRLLSYEQLYEKIAHSQIIYIADLHCLTKAQEYFVEILSKFLFLKKNLAVAIEFLPYKNQELLNKCLAGRIDDEVIIKKIKAHIPDRHERSYFQILKICKDNKIPVFAYDNPTSENDLIWENKNSLKSRDEFAANIIAQVSTIFQKVLVFGGEFHLMPSHLPDAVSKRITINKSFSIIIQNPDHLYFQILNKSLPEKLEAAEIAENKFCVFNVPIVTKYISWLELEAHYEKNSDFDLNSAYNSVAYLILENFNEIFQTKLRFSNFYPEICLLSNDEEDLSRLTLEKRKKVLKKLEKRGCLYLPETNSILIKKFRLAKFCEELGRHFLYRLNGEINKEKLKRKSREVKIFEECLIYFLSKIIVPERSFDLKNLTSEEMASKTLGQRLFQYFWTDKIPTDFVVGLLKTPLVKNAVSMELTKLLKTVKSKIAEN